MTGAPDHLTPVHGKALDRCDSAAPWQVIAHTKGWRYLIDTGVPRVADSVPMGRILVPGAQSLSAREPLDVLRLRGDWEDCPGEHPADVVTNARAILETSRPALSGGLTYLMAEHRLGRVDWETLVHVIERFPFTMPADQFRLRLFKEDPERRGNIGAWWWLVEEVYSGGIEGGTWEEVESAGRYLLSTDGRSALSQARERYKVEHQGYVVPRVPTEQETAQFRQNPDVQPAIPRARWVPAEPVERAIVRYSRGEIEWDDVKSAVAHARNPTASALIYDALEQGHDLRVLAASLPSHREPLETLAVIRRTDLLTGEEQKTLEEVAVHRPRPAHVPYVFLGAPPRDASEQGISDWVAETAATITERISGDLDLFGGPPGDDPECIPQDLYDELLAGDEALRTGIVGYAPDEATESDDPGKNDPRSGPVISIIGMQGSDRYLVSLGVEDDQGFALGRIYDRGAGTLFPSQRIGSITARGYWVDPTDSDLGAVLIEVTEFLDP